MYHHYDAVLNSKSGVPSADVIIRAFAVADDSIAPLFADESGTPIETASGIPNAAKSNADGNYDFFIADGFYNLRFYIGDALIQTIRNVQLKNAASADDVAALEASLLAKPDARAVVFASETVTAGEFVNVYNAIGELRVRKAVASDPAKFANGFASDAIASGAPGAIYFMGLNVAAAVPDDASEVWLSDTTPGSFTTSPPSNEGSIIQSLGPAIAGLGIFFTFRERVLL